MKRFLLFSIGGVINTFCSYGLYLVLSLFLNYQFAYLIAYILGIIFAYWFNTMLVFRVNLTWKTSIFYPLIYIIQYLISAILLEILVRKFSVAAYLAPLFVIACVTPLTYLMNKFLLQRYHNRARKVICP